jgi:hypothetical protein
MVMGSGRVVLLLLLLLLPPVHYIIQGFLFFFRCNILPGDRFRR